MLRERDVGNPNNRKCDHFYAGIVFSPGQLNSRFYDMWLYYAIDMNSSSWACNIS
jgi:hypothetical protein